MDSGPQVSSSAPVLPRSGNDLEIVDAYPVSHPVSIIGDV